MFITKFKAVYVCALALCLASAACSGPNQELRDFWKGTKGYYYEYLNTPVMLTLQDTSEHSDYTLRLGAAMSAVDEELRQLCRVMDDSDRGVDNEWVMSTLRRFPWLAGLAVLDGDGFVLARVPQYSLKDFQPDQLFEEDPKQRRTNLRAFALDGALGPEIYIGKPVYIADELRAMIVAHFDMRALLDHRREAAAMVIATPEVILWQGIYDLSETPIPMTDWKAKVKSEVFGAVSNERGRFYWCFTYFANLPIIYAIEESGDFTRSPEQIELLDSAGAFAAPNINLTPSAVTAPPDQPDQADGDDYAGEALEE
ncbi:MAG: hypothetical protein LBM64_04625 [Deltaproteobacteria bacterium]|nr:hypothetical protein [Deltaproteobacteria bacterium]